MHGEHIPKLKIEKIRQNIHDQTSQKIQREIERCQLKDKTDNKDVKDKETTTTSEVSWPLEDVSLKDKTDNKDVKDKKTTTTLADSCHWKMSSSRTR